MKTLPPSLRWLASPLCMRVWWALFAVLFYLSGLAFTTLLLEPEQFGGGLDRVLAAMFPLLIPLFFVVNYYLGCVSGMCRMPRERATHGSAGDDTDTAKDEGKRRSQEHYTRPPGI